MNDDTILDRMAQIDLWDKAEDAGRFYYALLAVLQLPVHYVTFDLRDVDGKTEKLEVDFIDAAEIRRVIAKELFDEEE